MGNVAKEQNIEQQYANEFGVSLSEAQARLALQVSVSGFVDTVTKLVPTDKLAGIWVDNGPTYRVVVELVEGSDVSLVTPLAGATTLPVSVVAARTYSVAALSSAISAHIEGWVRQQPAINGISIDESKGEIVFYVDGSKVRAGTVDVTALTDLPARVAYDTSAGGDQMYGGLNLTSCTAAFTAKNTSTGVKGYFTAAHCGTQAYQFPNTGGSWFTSSYHAQRYDGFTDIQFRGYNSHLPKAFFYGNSASTLSANAPASTVSTGSYLCHRGKTTGYRCGSVTSITYVPTWAGACQSATCQPVWVRTTAYAQGGDSGGPWFINTNSGVGIHKGGASDGSYSVYAKIAYRPANTSVCSASTCP